MAGPDGADEDAGGPGRAFDEIAREFDRARARPWEFVVDWLRTLEVPRGPLLDVGCGNGRHMELAGALGHECVGVDASGPMLEAARARLGPAARLVLGDARALSFASGKASAVLAVAVVHHLRSAADRACALREMGRVLRPGGRGLVSVWALDDPAVAARARARAVPGPASDGADLLVPWRATPGGPVDRYYRVVRADELESLCASAGMRVVWSGDRGANHVVVAERVWPGHTPNK